MLERIGLAPMELIESYREAYKKRLKKMNFNEDMFKEDFHLPELNILNKDELWGNETDKRNITLSIEAKDTAYALDRINVFVNEVPIFGTNGINLREQNTNLYNANITIELSDSVNKIQVSVLNQAGVESLKDFFDITYKPVEKYNPKTYFIGIGVSDYQNKDMNLNFAARDIRDLSKAYSERYPDVEIDTLINDKAVKEKILALKEKLLKTNVNDEIIIALSGHGILNKKYDFYYATFDMDFQNPELRGLMFDDLDKLLDSIPARKKVLLIDACNSGEVEKDSSQNSVFSNQNPIARTDSMSKGIRILQQDSKLGLSNSFELMQEIFVNLTRGNGAVVISAAGGYQSALEGKQWGNGVFTYCILKGLKDREADKNKDGVITVSELKDYVSEQVEKLTNGRQKPTSRRENLEYDFRVW
ncbi:MAG: caspase family protein [Ignavibacteriae bacterium]|nr:caspase family protein [Ignavibacteriota bacterium]